MYDKVLFQKGITKALEQWGKPDLVVSGGARGADTMGERWAREHKIPVTIFKPDWKLHGKKAGILRNADIIKEATHVLAFPSKSGRGTQNSIKRARDADMPLLVYYIEEH